MWYRLAGALAALAVIGCGGSNAPATAPSPAERTPSGDTAPAPEPVAPTQLASGQGNLVGVEVDATHVYWLEFDTGEIRRMPLDGGAVDTVVPAGADALAEEMALVGDFVYWTTRTQNAILRAPKAGGPIETIASNQAFATAIKADNTYLYWTADGAVRRMPIAGGPIEDIDVGGPAGEQLELDAGFLYVAGVNGSTIVGVDKRTGAHKVLAYDDTSLGSTLAVFNEHLYYTASDDSIRRVSRHGADERIIAPPRGGTYALAVGMEGVYWGADADNGMGAAVYRMPRDSDPAVVAAGYQSIGDIVLSPNAVYFIDQDGGTVNTIARATPRRAD